MQKEDIESQASDLVSINNSPLTTAESVSPISTPSPKSLHPEEFRDQPIDPELYPSTSIFEQDPDRVNQIFQSANTSSISTVSSLSSSSNPLDSATTSNSAPKSKSKTILPTVTSTTSASTKMNTRTPARIHELPIPGSKFAPKKFTGKHSRAKRFTDHYDRLIEGISGMTDRQKCESMMQYCSTKVSDFLEQLISYKNSNYSQLIRDIHDYYDVQLTESRWREKDLVKLVKEYKTTKVKTLSQWKAYNRRFLRIANWLLNKNRIDKDHYRTYFWDGIHRNLQEIFETRLLNKDPGVDLTKPFKIEEVQKVANQYFMRDKFGALVEDSEESDSDSESFESTDEEDTSSSDDSDDDYKKKRKNAKHHSKTKRKLDYYRKKLQASREEKDSSKPKGDSASSSKKDAKSAEMDELIDKLKKMSVNSPEYGYTYYKAMKLDKTIADCLKKPVTESIPMNQQSYQQSRGFKPGQRVFSVSPATGSNTIAQQESRVTYKGPLFNPAGDDRCFGCGGRGHTIRGCQKITQLIQSGITIRSPSTGQIVMSDGSYIRRQQGETLVEAAERLAETKADISQVRVAMIRPTTFYHDSDTEYDSDTESEYEFEQNPDYRSDSQLYSDDSSEEEEEYSDEGSEEDEFDDEDYHGSYHYKSRKRHPRRVYEIGPEKSARTTRSARQRISERFSEKPRGETDRKKKGLDKIVPESKEPQAIVSIPQPVISASQGTSSKPIQDTRLSVQAPSPRTVIENKAIQGTIPKPRQINKNVEITPVQSYPPTAKPYVEVPKIITKPKKVPASESIKEVRMKSPIEELIPVSSRTPRKIRSDDEDSDRPVAKRIKKSSRGKYMEYKENLPMAKEQNTEPGTLKRVGRKSELSSKINDNQIIDKLLDVTVPLKVSEILAVSPRVAISVSEMMKPKNRSSLKTQEVFKTNQIHKNEDMASVNLASKRSLINVTFTSNNDEPIQAIVDTGSEINVINKEYCGTIIGQPMRATRVGMQDASGGHSKLKGLIEEVPLNCGKVRTKANLFVGENLPYKLLLGRAWQRENFVSIDERSSGTYLVFKDKNNPDDPRLGYELQVSRADVEFPEVTHKSMTSLVLSVNKQDQSTETQKGKCGDQTDEIPRSDTTHGCERKHTVTPCGVNNGILSGTKGSALINTEEEAMNIPKIQIWEEGAKSPVEPSSKPHAFEAHQIPRVREISKMAKFLGNLFVQVALFIILLIY